MSTPVNTDPSENALRRPAVIDRIAAVAVAMIVLSFLTWVPLGQSFIYKLDDQISRWIGFRSSPDIVVITLDDRSIEQLGGWPIARSHYADLLKRLAQPAYRPRVVGLDILLMDPRAEDAELAQAMALLPVVLPVYQEGLALTEEKGPSPDRGPWQQPLAVLAKATQQGHIHMRLDSDGVVRGFQPVADGVPHFVLAMVNAAGLKLKRSPLDQKEVRVNMVDPAVGFPAISLSNALDPSFPLEIVKNKWVLVGSTSNSLGDMHVTPFTGRTGSLTPGVFVLASNLNAVMHDDWMGIAPASGVFAFSALLLALWVLFTSRWRPTVMLRMQVGIIIAVTGLKVLLLLQAHWWLNSAPLCVALLFGWLYWISRKLEHTFAFMKRQVQNLPQTQNTSGSATAHPRRPTLSGWSKSWRDPIHSVSTELQARTAHMRESLGLLDAIVLQLPDALAVFDAQGHLVVSNPSMRRYWAWQGLSEASDNRVMTLAMLRQALGFDPATSISPGSPIRLESPLGTMHYLCTENSIEDSQDLPLHLVRMHDITQLREQEHQRKKTLEFLSHDMRTPVAAIAAVANTLVRKPLQIAQSAQDIAQYTERLMEMMDGFIDYSQATLTELKTDLHLVSNLLDDALSQVQVLAEQQRTRFVVEETEYPLAIECNAHLMVRALVNTLVNALHHGQAGGEVMVSTELVKLQPQAMAVLLIRNQVGKAPSHPLVRGFGLGLAFVRMVMERHGGSMTASWWGTPASSTFESSSATLRLEIPNVELGTDV
jgi:CHASE2 domain-containing sensor protein/signal transduction histidine kinase